MQLLKNNHPMLTPHTQSSKRLPLASGQFTHNKKPQKQTKTTFDHPGKTNSIPRTNLPPTTGHDKDRHPHIFNNSKKKKNTPTTNK